MNDNITYSSPSSSSIETEEAATLIVSNIIHPLEDRGGSIGHEGSRDRLDREVVEPVRPVVSFDDARRQQREGTFITPALAGFEQVAPAAEAPPTVAVATQMEQTNAMECSSNNALRTTNAVNETTTISNTTSTSSSSSCPICFEEYTVVCKINTSSPSHNNVDDVQFRRSTNMDAVNDQDTFTATNDDANDDHEDDPVAVVSRVVLQRWCPDENGSTVVTGCGHAFCRNCLTQHCVYAIQAKRVPIPCPYEVATSAATTATTATAVGVGNGGTSNDGGMEPVVACPFFIPDTVVQSMLTTPNKFNTNDIDNQTQARYWNRYQTLVTLGHNNSHLMECPRCDNGIIDIIACQRHDDDEPNRSDGHGQDDDIEDDEQHFLRMDDGGTRTVHATVTTPTRSSSSSLPGWGPNDVRCPACLGTVCRIHGTAHMGIPCARYTSMMASSEHTNHGSPPPPLPVPIATRTAASLFRGRNKTHNSPDTTATTTNANGVDNELLTMRALATFTKPCSHCGCHLQKAAGCDHVICPSCRQDLCWRCGTHVHLTGQVVRHCSQCQRDYRDHRYDHVYRFRLTLCLPVLIPLFMVYSMVLFAVATATGCFCGCFQCGRCLMLHQQTTKPPTTNSPNNQHSPAALPVTAATPSSPSSPADARTGTSAPPTATRLRGSARLGMWATVVVVFLPAIALMEDFGFHVDILDELFPEPYNATEMPYLEVELNTV